MSMNVNGFTQEIALPPREPADKTPQSCWPDAAGADVPRRSGAEQYDTILWRLRGCAEPASDTGCLVGVTGCQRSSGTSTVAANLAIRAADHGMVPALLVDANFAHPQQHRLLRTARAPGLVELILEGATPEQAIRPTTVSGLSLLPLGGPNALEHALSKRDRFAAALTALRRHYRLLVFDLPEALDLQHRQLLANQLDATLLVVRTEAVRRRTAQIAMGRLLSDGFNVAGAVVTGQQNYLPSWLERYL